MSKKKISVCENQQPLPMVLPPAPTGKEITFKPIKNPIWTENKAKLIERYLYYFVLITHHGTYIDGFAGPQEIDKPEMWAANLVMNNEPRWMRHFFLYDADIKKYEMLKSIREVQPQRDSKNRKIYRDINIFHGDFNELIKELLSSEAISQKEATFCLLDQRTFECKWSTVEALSKYKEPGRNKIELFYFLPNYWQDRALSGLKTNKDFATEWWGGSNSEELRAMGQNIRRDLMCEKLKEDLGYKYVTPWPIYEKAKGKGAVMYYMIHATDHDEAPKLMQRAYGNAVTPKEPVEQLKFLFPEVEILAENS